MKKRIVLILAYMALLITVTLVIIACTTEGCIGNGACSVFIGQGAYGLFIDDVNYPRSTCGKSATWNSDLGKYTGGCKVQNNIDNYDNKRKYGTHGCDC